MTASVYQTIKLVQLVAPDGEWYVAIPHPQNPDADPENSEQLLAVDTGKNLTFADTFTRADVETIKEVEPLNRFAAVRLEFIPGMVEASVFHLLANVLHQSVSNIEWRQSSPQKKFDLLVSGSACAALGRGLQQTLTTEPERAETRYVEHDFIAHGLQSALIQSGIEDEAE